MTFSCDPKIDPIIFLIFTQVCFCFLVAYNASDLFDKISFPDGQGPGQMMTIHFCSICLEVFLICMKKHSLSKPG